MAPIYKTVVHVPTGEFKNTQGLFECGPFEPQRPMLSVINGITNYDPDYDVVVVESIPDPRSQKWGGSAVIAKTQAEIDAYDAARPRYVDSRVMLLRMTSDEKFKLWKLANVDANTAGLVMLFLSRAGKVDVHDPLSRQGWAYLKTIGLNPPAEAGITPIWPDAATVDARIVAITA